MLAALLSVVVVAEPAIAFVRMAGSEVQLVVQNRDGSEEVLNSRRLPLKIPTEPWLSWHNDSLLKSFAVSFDRRTRRFFLLDVKETIRGKDGTSEGWKSKCAVITTDFKGRVLRTEPVVVPWVASTTLGHDGSGRALLVREEWGCGKFAVTENGRWVPRESASLPPAFQTLQESGRKLETAGASLAGLSEPRMEMAIPESPDWVDLEFPEPSANSPNLLGAAVDGAASAIYNGTDIEAGWPQGRLRRSFPKGRRLTHIRMLEYPMIVGTVQGFDVLDPFKPYLVFTHAPYVASTVYTFNLATGALSPVGAGLYGIPLGPVEARRGAR